MSAKNSRRIVTDAPLKDVVIFVVLVTLWSGRGKLVHEDLGIDTTLLPPEALASLGSKRLIDPASLKPLLAVKRKMLRLLASTGLRFLTGYAQSRTTAKAVAAELKKLVKEGEAAKEAFLKRFDEKAQAWQDENPKWGHIIRAALPTKERVASKITFNWQCMMANTPDDKELADKLTAEADGLAGVLWAEVENEASDFVVRSLSSARNGATQKTIAPVRRMVEKLNRLCFLDHRVGPIVDVLEAALNTLPVKGKIVDDQYLTLVSIAAVLADAGRMQAIGQQVIDGRAVEDCVGEIVKLQQSSAARDGLSGEAVSIIADMKTDPAANAIDEFFASEPSVTAVSAEILAADASPRKEVKKLIALDF